MLNGYIHVNIHHTPQSFLQVTFPGSLIWSFRLKKQQIKRVTVSFGAILGGKGVGGRGCHLCDSSLCWETWATNRFPLSFKLSQSSVEIISWTLRLSHVSVSQEGKPRDYVAFGHSGLQQLLGGGNCPLGRRVFWNQKERHHHHQEVQSIIWTTWKKWLGGWSLSSKL